MPTRIREFLSGAVMMACLAVGYFFFRYWVRTRDRLFLMFSMAFALLAVERVVLVTIWIGNEVGTSVYLIRLAAFLLIILAVVDKNRHTRPPS